ncbi:MAG: DUF4416 family protein [Planctomycetota bacterium]
MGKYRDPSKVKLFAGIITKFREEVGLVKGFLEKRFGEIDLETEPSLFDYNDYYRQEQGSPLFRIFYSFSNLIKPDELAKIKRWTNFIEEILKSYKKWDVRRPFNLDPGYLSLSSVVLASTKPCSHRLYLGHYIYAEVTLLYKNKTFIYMPWTYRDYRSQEYGDFFSKMRDILYKVWRGKNDIFWR